MCHNEITTRKYQHNGPTQEDWDRAKEKWNEFSQKFATRMNEAREWGGGEAKHVVDVTLPNGRQFSFTLGHLLLAGLVLVLLPFNLIILAGLLFLAYQFGNSNGDPRKRHDDDKAKRKTDEPAQDIEVYTV